MLVGIENYVGFPLELAPDDNMSRRVRKSGERLQNYHSKL